MANKNLDSLRIVFHLIAAKLRFKLLRGPVLRAYQNARANKLLRYAAAHSPFHAARFSGHNPDHWRQLPFIEKSDMMQHFDTYNTAGVRLEPAMQIALAAEEGRVFTDTIAGHTVGISSGTSGHRGIFLVSHAEQLQWAGEILSHALPSFRLSGWNVALFMRSNSNLYETVGSHWLRFKYFDLLTPLQQSVETLNHFQPGLLIAPASMLLLLQHEKMQGRLNISPTRIIAIAEVLEDTDKASLQTTFNTPVHQIYQCTEGLLAACCPLGSLHLLEDVIAIDLEVLSEDSDTLRAIPIITDLWRRTQPIIRYRLNDVLLIDKHLCPCGSAFRVLRAIEGRSDDILFALDAAGNHKPLFADLIRKILLLSSSNITDYLVLQRTVSHWNIYLDVHPPEAYPSAAATLQQRLHETFDSLHLIHPSIQIAAGVPPREPDRKRRRVQRDPSLRSLSTILK